MPARTPGDRGVGCDPVAIRVHPQRPALFVNPNSGDGAATRAGLVDAARERGIATTVLTPDASLEHLVRDAAENGADALGMAGGDGSLGVVAAAALEHGLPFVCVPSGTRNHFARDLGISPHDQIAALDAFTDGVERVIDVGDVNGRIFLNNVSIGIYGDAVQQPSYRDAKLRTLLKTADEVLSSEVAAPDFTVVDDAGREHRNPAVLLVSNNPYALAGPGSPGARPALDSGHLGVIVIDAPDPVHAPGRDWTATELDVQTQEPAASGIDGEAVELAPPVRFRIRPAALRVLSARDGGSRRSLRRVRAHRR
jgi:diacylglycerol kinase family enzyme